MTLQRQWRIRSPVNASSAEVAQQLVRAFHSLAYAEALKVKWFGTADKGEIASICASDPGNYATLANLHSYEKMYKERSDAIRGSGLAPVITFAHALSYDGWNGLGKFAGGGAAIWILKADGREIPPEIAYDFLEGTGAVAGLAIGVSTASIASGTARPLSLPSPRSVLATFRNIRITVTTPCGNVAPNSIVDPNKFKYVFGEVTSGTHNTQRSLQNAAQMNRIGIHNTAEGQKYLTQHLQRVAQDPSSVARTIQKMLPDGSTITLEVRESLLSGPGGFLKLESTWEILADGTRRLSNIIPFGG